MYWFFNGIANYANFNGRARRREYWMYILFWYIGLFAATVIDAIMAAVLDYEIFNIVKAVYCLCLLLPTLAVAVRRLHDTDRSGWWLFIGLIPIIGPVWQIVLFCLDGTVGPNRYGPDPKNRKRPGPPNMVLDELDGSSAGIEDYILN